MYIFFLDPSHCDPPHRVTRPHQANAIAETLKSTGWDGPPLIGYPKNGKVVLLTGTHRHAAAFKLGVKIPVEVFPVQEVEEAWGDLEKWGKIMAPAVTVKRKYKFLTPDPNL